MVRFESPGSSDDDSTERQTSPSTDMEALALPEPVDPTLTLDIPHVDRLALPRKEQAQSPDSTGSGVSTQGVLSANEADQPPRELSNAQPIYPRLARRRGAEGQVDLHLLIDDSGRVQRLEVARVVGHESFRNAVLEAARCWRFSPALRDGVPVSVWADKSIHFEID